LGKEGNKADRKHKQLEGNRYSLKRSKWQAAVLFNTARPNQIKLAHRPMLAAFPLTTARDKH